MVFVILGVGVSIHFSERWKRQWEELRHVVYLSYAFYVPFYYRI